jgi:hypothetical protein
MFDFVDGVEEIVRSVYQKHIKLWYQKRVTSKSGALGGIDRY